MLSDKESKLEMSPRDYFQMMATPENGLGELVSSLEEQENILDENESDHSSLFTSLNEIRKFDPDVYLEVMDTLIELVNSKKISAKDIPKLITSLETADEASGEILKQYGSERGAMAWRNYVVTIYGELKTKDAEGNLTYNIGQHLNHEIGHSIFEIGAINLNNVQEIFEDIETEFESGHIKRVESASASSELIFKERFAELAAIYLRSNSQADFYQLRAKNCPSDIQKEIEINPETAKKFESECIKLYQRINLVWPQIQKNLAGVDLEEHLQNIEATDEMAEFDEFGNQIDPEPVEEPVTGAEQVSNSQEGASDSGAEHKESKQPAASYPETRELAKKHKVNPSTAETLKQFAAAFGELDIISGN